MSSSCTVIPRDLPALATGWFYAELSVTSLLKQWRQQSTQQPVVLLDFTSLRAQRLATAQQNVAANLAVELAHHPLTYLTLPIIAWPEITVSLSLPKVVLPRHTLAATADLASHFTLAFAVALALLFAGPIAVLETQSIISRATSNFDHYQTVSEPNLVPSVTPTPTPEPTPSITSPRDVFSLSIPELGIESTITPNVNPAQPQQYQKALQEGIAHAAGSGLPDQLDVSKTIYLFAHSTDAEWNIARYNAEFYGLKDAAIGQKITLRFWGQDYQYEITDKQIVPADDTTWLMPQWDQEQLVLQTCYPPGTTWKRLLVIAQPVAIEK